MRVLLLGLLTLCISAGAELEWKQQAISLEVQPTQIEARAVFSFTNNGDSPVSIKNVMISCGCLSPGFDPERNYAPGEKGEVVITLDLANRTGKQYKYIMVETSDDKSTELEITADVPVAYEVEPQLLLWEKGDTAETKTVRLHNPNKKPIKLLSIASSKKEMPARLKVIKEGFEYEVIVTRKTAESAVRSVIRIAMEPPAGMKNAKTIRIYGVAM